MKRFMGQVTDFLYFYRQNLKVLLWTCSTTELGLTTRSIMLTKIVHRTRDCVGIIAGVQHIDGPLQVKYWRGWGGGFRTPVTPAVLTPMRTKIVLMAHRTSRPDLRILRTVIRLSPTRISQIAGDF